MMDSICLRYWSGVKLPAIHSAFVAVVSAGGAAVASRFCQRARVASEWRRRAAAVLPGRPLLMIQTVFSCRSKAMTVS